MFVLCAEYCANEYLVMDRRLVVIVDFSALTNRHEPLHVLRTTGVPRVTRKADKAACFPRAKAQRQVIYSLHIYFPSDDTPLISDELTTQQKW